MMVVHFKAIEDTLLSMEERYDIKLTDGLESFLVLVCNRIFKDRRIDVWNPNDPFKKVPFRKAIFMDACKEVFPVYQDGALDRECQRRNIPFLEEVDRTFQKIRERLDREAQEDTDGAEDWIMAEYRLGLTRYQMDVSREELIRRGKWYLMQISLREWDNDDGGIFYCSQRMFREGIVFPERELKDGFFYVIEPARTKWDDKERESNRLYIRAEVYDALIREIFEPYGKVEFCREKYVLRITGMQACGAASADIEERWWTLVEQKEPKYPDVRAVYYGLMQDCLYEVKGVFYWLNQAEKEETVELSVFGAYCLCEETPEEKVEDTPMSSLHINHEELIQTGKKLLRKEVQEWCSGCPADPETEFYLANYALLTDYI